jgi:hypothetical protein
VYFPLLCLITAEFPGCDTRNHRPLFPQDKHENHTLAKFAEAKSALEAWEVFD